MEADELIRLRLSGRAGQTRGAPVAAAPSLRPPLSFAQERLWFITELRPDSTAYNVPAAYRMSGPLNVAALEAALTQVLTRHAVLRTHYAVAGGQPYQVIEPAAPVQLVRHDAGSAPDPIRQARQVVWEAVERPFDLATGPLFRALLIRLGVDDHVLGIVVHHSVFDRQSLEIWAGEVSAAYAAVVAGRRPAAEPLPVQYADYAAWQRERLSGDVLAGHLAYWRHRLAEAPPVLELPADLARPPVPSFAAGVVDCPVPADIADPLRRIAASRGATLFMVALAGYHALLSRYTAAPDVLVGCPVNGRSKPAFERLIGFFANSVPIRARLGADPTFVELVDQVRAATLDAYAHQELPFDRMVEELDTSRDLSRNPLVQVWFDLASVRSPADPSVPRLPGLRVEPFDTGRVRTRFDTELHLTDAGSGPLGGRLHYATDLFEHETMATFARHYVNLLRAAAQGPQRRLSDLTIFRSDELHQIIEVWGTAS